MGETAATTFNFDSLAEAYDGWYETPEGGMYDRLEKRAVARFLPEAITGRELLDVGSGTGHWSRFFSDRGFAVTGVDISPSMVRVADGKKIKRASFQVADAHRLPFEDRRFDTAVAIATLEFVREPDLVMREMVRCTRKPGGVLVIGALNAPAKINRRRKEAGTPPYHAARLLSLQELKAMLEPYGETRVVSAAFAPQARRLLALAPIWDAIARALRLPGGAFLVGKVTL